MGLLNKLGFEKGPNGWEMTPEGKIKNGESAKRRAEHFIEQAEQAYAVGDLLKAKTNKDMARRLLESAQSNGLLNGAQVSEYYSRINAI